MKKKSLLLAISAMSIAAIGVGTVGTFAWFQANASISAAMVGDTASVTVATTSAINAGLKFTVVKDTETTIDAQQCDLTGVQITNSSGETYFYDANAAKPVKGTLTKGYATAVFDISVELTGSSNMTLQDALKAYYTAGTHSVYLRVTDSGQAVVSDSTSTVYSACTENDKTLTTHRTALIELALAADGSTQSWANKTVYASVRNQAANDGAFNAATYTAGLSATIGSESADFDPAA